MNELFKKQEGWLFHLLLFIILSLLSTPGIAQNESFKTSMDPYLKFSMGFPVINNHILVNAEVRPFNKKYSLNYSATYLKVTSYFPDFFRILNREERHLGSIGISKIFLKKHIVKNAILFNAAAGLSPYLTRTILYYEDSTKKFPGIVGASLTTSLNLIVKFSNRFSFSLAGELLINKDIYQFNNENINSEYYYEFRYLVGIMYVFR